MVFFLKTNTDTAYAIRNLQHWINIIRCCEKSIIYIICDKEELTQKLISNLKYDYLDVKFVKSIRNDYTYGIAEKITNQSWVYAGLAHMTPFLIAKENNYSKYWNIDADDTLFCLDYERVAELLLKAENYAYNNGIDLFSLDMWRSRCGGRHWSFGITYTNGEIDWIDVIRKNYNYIGSHDEFVDGIHPKNIDEFFTYIKNHDFSVKIETFYFENLMFIHYSEDFIFNPIQSAIYRWKNKRVQFPLLLSVYDNESQGDIEIYQDVIKLDIGITAYEGSSFLAKAANYTIEAENVIEAREYSDMTEKYILNQSSEILENIDIENKRIYVFGYVEMTKKIIDLMISKNIGIQAILDNNPLKQSGSYKGIAITSPDILKGEDYTNVIVFICVKHYEKIKIQVKNISEDISVVRMQNLDNILS